MMEPKTGNRMGLNGNWALSRSRDGRAGLRFLDGGFNASRRLLHISTFIGRYALVNYAFERDFSGDNGSVGNLFLQLWV